MPLPSKESLDSQDLHKAHLLARPTFESSLSNINSLRHKFEQTTKAANAAQEELNQLSRHSFIEEELAICVTIQPNGRLTIYDEDTRLVYVATIGALQNLARCVNRDEVSYELAKLQTYHVGL